MRPGEGRTAEMGTGRAAAFITKPVGEAELRGEVAALLQRQPALIEHPA